MCPGGKCPGGTCPGGLCPRTNLTLGPNSLIFSNSCNHTQTLQPLAVTVAVLVNLVSHPTGVQIRS